MILSFLEITKERTEAETDATYKSMTSLLKAFFLLEPIWGVFCLNVSKGGE
jgi:hypothetical protein